MNTPKIRFKGYTDDWEQRKFQWLVDESIIDTPMDGNHGEKHPTTEDYVDSGIPFLMASDIHDGIANINNCKFISAERASMLDKGFARNEDVLITHKATIGEVAILKGLETDYAMLTPQVTYYRIKDHSRLSQTYLYAWFNSDSFQQEIKSKAAQSTRAYIGISAQRELTIQMPNSIAEQEAIGNFIYNLDNLITLHQRKCDRLNAVKKYMLQKMFPKNGAKVPEIRFKGYTDAWEQRKVSELLEERNEQEPECSEYPLMAFIANEGVAPKGERYDRGALIKDAKNKLYKRTELGDFIYSSNNLESGSIGLNNYGKASISPVYSIFKPTGIADGDFIGRRFVRKDFINSMIKWRQGVLYGQWRIHEKDFLNIEIEVPSLKEQAVIGRYFSHLDNLITLHQRKCDSLKELKKFMLQNMFP